VRIASFPRHLFWNYSPDADLPDEVVTRQVILYGDLQDLFKLSATVPHELIRTINQDIALQGRWEKRVYFVDKIILES
jgi:hypothetical protein